MNRCPNCNEPIHRTTPHSENGCLLGVISRCVIDRGKVPVVDINRELLETDVFALWDLLGPIIDDFETLAARRALGTKGGA